MKIVTWNCNGALRNKLAAIDKLEADIYVIQECEDPDKSTKVFRNWAVNNWGQSEINEQLGPDTIESMILGNRIKRD